MSLNIKNEETHQLVRELARRTGQSQTAAVADAVRRRLAELHADDDRQGRYDRIMEISRRASEAMSEESKTWDYDEFLYDEYGLPR